MSKRSYIVLGSLLILSGLLFSVRAVEAARTEGFWSLVGDYLKTTSATGYDILINGIDRYLNFGFDSGSSGYGFRDNGGVIEFKNSGGAWAGIGSGSGGSDFTLQTNFGATNAATTTPIWAQGGLNASSTVRATLFEALDWTLSTSTVVCASGCEFTNIQTAIDAGWDNIKLKNETYTLTAPITPIANNLTVEGEGYNTVISCNPATVPTCLTNNNASQKSNLVFRDFTVDNSGTTGTGTCVDLSRFARSTFTNVNCQDFNAGYSASTSQTFYNNIENTFVRVSGASSTAFLFTNDANYNTIFNARVNPTNDDRVTGFYIDSHTMKCISCEVESYAGVGLHVAAHGHAFNGDMYLELNKVNAQIDSGVENVNLTGNYADASTTPQNIVDNGARGLFVNARVQYEPVNYINGNPFSIDDVSLDYSDTKASNQLEISSTIGTTSLMIVSTKNGTWIDEELKGGIEFYGSDTSGSGVGSHAYIRAQAEGTFGVSTNLLFGTSNGGGNGVDVLKLEHDGDAIFTGNLLPDVSDGSTLGDATHFVSDLFLADEGVINWNNSDMTINHSTNNLTISGGELYVAGGLLSQGSTTFSGVSSTTFDGPGFRIGGPRDTGSSYYNVFQNASDILTIQRTGGTDDSFSLVKIAANPTCAPSCEGTLTLELNPNKFLDIFADDYTGGTQQYGMRAQKRSTQTYMPICFDFYDGSTVTNGLCVATTSAAAGTTLGFVGAGTTTPRYQLVSHGDIFAQGNVIVNRDTTSNFGCLQFQTNWVDQWCVGLRNDGTTHLQFRDNINGRNKLTIPRSTATSTLLDGIDVGSLAVAGLAEVSRLNATGTATSTFAGGILSRGWSSFASTTISMLNGTIVVDGVHYAQNDAGVRGAIEDACASTNNRHVHFPSGQYDISSASGAISLCSNLMITGDGYSSFLNQTGTTNVALFNNENATVGVSNIVIKNIRIRSRLTAGYPGGNPVATMRFDGAASTTIDTVWIERGGIHFRPNTTFSNTATTLTNGNNKYNTVSNSFFDEESLICVVFSQGSHSSAINNKCHAYDSAFQALGAWDDIKFIGNTIYDHDVAGYGFEANHDNDLEKWNDLQIIGNTSSSSPGSGAIVYGGTATQKITNTRIIDNHFASTTEYGIYINGVHEGFTVVNNNCENIGRACVAVVNDIPNSTTTDGIIANNNSHNAGTSGTHPYGILLRTTASGAGFDTITVQNNIASNYNSGGPTTDGVRVITENANNIMQNIQIYGNLVRNVANAFVESGTGSVTYATTPFRGGVSVSGYLAASSTSGFTDLATFYNGILMGASSTVMGTFTLGDGVGNTSFTSSSGDLTINATGDDINIGVTDTVVIPGSLRTNSTLDNSNLGVAAGQTGANRTTSQLLLPGSSAIGTRVLVRGSTNYTVTAGSNYGSFIVGQEAITEASSGNHPILSQLGLRPLAVTAGSATVANTATIYVEDAASTTVATTGNYSMWVDNGTVRFDDKLAVGTTTPWATALSASGTVAFQNLSTGAAATDINITANKELIEVTSSKRFKDHIGNLDASQCDIERLQAVMFRWKEGTYSAGMEDVGLYAEDVAEVCPLLVVYKDGLPYSVRYELLSVYLLDYMQEKGGLSEPAFEQGGFDPSDYWYLAFLSIPLSWFMNRRKKHAYQP